MAKVDSRGYWQQHKQNATEKKGISQLAKDCHSLLLSLSQGRHGLRHIGMQLLPGFSTWVDHEKPDVNTLAGLDFLLQDDNTVELYLMTIQELKLIHKQLLELQQRAANRPRKRRRKEDRISTTSERPSRSTKTRQSYPENPNPDQYLTAKSVSSGLTSASSNNTSPELKKACSKIEGTLERLKQVSSFSRQIAVESRFPELDQFLDGENDERVRQIFPRARDLMSEKFPSAAKELQIRLSAFMSKKVGRLVHDKQSIKEEILSEPSLGFASYPLVRSQTLEVDSPKWEHMPSTPPRRSGTDPQQWNELSGQYPPSVNDHDIQELDSTYVTSPPGSPMLFGTEPARAQVMSDQVECGFYVCNFLECEAKTFFDDKLKWEQHLYNRHQLAPFWICSAIRHGEDLPEFDSVITFEQHMRKEHDGSFDESDLPELADACKMPGEQPPRKCPLCSIPLRSESTKSDPARTFIKHMMQHFLELDKISLEWVPEYQSMESDPPYAQWIARGIDWNVHSADRTVSNSWVKDHCNRLSNTGPS